MTVTMTINIPYSCVCNRTLKAQDPWMALELFDETFHLKNDNNNTINNTNNSNNDNNNTKQNKKSYVPDTETFNRTLRALLGRIEQEADQGIAIITTGVLNLWCCVV